MQHMDHLQVPSKENNMCETSINQFLKAARQHLLGSDAVQADLAADSTLARPVH
ncbi:MAG: hypothetical protein JNK92_10610 [Dechloromonas sp.]|nr:hypothetical protein [Dechloromonas sp.]